MLGPSHSFFAKRFAILDKEYLPPFSFAAAGGLQTQFACEMASDSGSNTTFHKLKKSAILVHVVIFLKI